MKHASLLTLDKIEPLLAELRKLPIIEKSPGVFYTKRGAFLHFHEGPAGIFADIKCKEGWKRLIVSTKIDQKKILILAKAQL